MRTLLALALFALAGCSTLTLAPSDFAWPIMSELTADRNGNVKEERYHLAFNIKPLLFEELKDSVNVAGKKLSIIRDRQGFYYVTGPKFKKVYVFQHTADGLGLSTSYEVQPAGLSDPEFEQRPPNIRLRSGRESWLLTRYGVTTPPPPATGGAK